MPTLAEQATKLNTIYPDTNHIITYTGSLSPGGKVGYTSG
jgi:hypothetical protein